MDIPLSLGLDFDFHFDSQSTYDGIDIRIDENDFLPRSPQSPKFVAGSPPSSPFDPSRFFRFPLDPPSIEASPISPPSSPLAKSSINETLKENSDLTTPPPTPPPLPPHKPLSWIWICHLCHSRYPLGVTRRCLVDGHWYCSGMKSGTDQRNVKKKKKGHACSSEFDYVGWQDWLCWRQKASAHKQKLHQGANQGRATSVLRGCESCEYPSQCRYEKLNQIPSVVPTTSKKISIKDDDSPLNGNAQTIGRTAQDAQDKSHNETMIAPCADIDTSEPEHPPAVIDLQNFNRKFEAVAGGEPKPDRERPEKTTGKVPLPQLTRSRSGGIKYAKDKFGLKQSQILDFFRVAGNL